MPNKVATKQQLVAENKDLSEQLEQAEASLREILSGEADALFISGAAGAEIFTINGADRAYRTLIENMGEGALTLTPSGLVLYANRCFAEMLGMSLEKVMGSDIFSWFAPESRQVVQTMLLKDTPDKHSEELVLAAMDGTQVPVYLSVNRIVLDGKLNAYGMVVTDLTMQKRNEAILAGIKLERAILDQAADAIIICDQNGRIIRASKQAQIYNDTNLLGQQFAQAFPLCSLDGTAISPAGHINASSCQSLEVRMEHNTEEFNFLLSIGHMKGVQNELLGSVVTLTNICERKTAELALQKYEAQLSEAMKIAKIGYWEYEIATKEFIFNDKYYLLHKITAEEAGGYRVSAADFIHRYVHPEHKSDVGKIMQLALASSDPNYPAITESRILTGEGETIWVEIRFRVEKDLQGNPIRLIGVNQDITEHKKSESSIKYLNRLLSVLSGINTLILRVTDREELFRESCDIAIEKGGFRLAMIVLVDQSTMQPSLIISAGKNEEALEDIKKAMSSGEGMEKSMVALAIRGKKAIISNDTQYDPDVLYGSKYAEVGINSISVIPLIIADEAVGAFSLYASEIGFFHEEELKLLTELAGDVAFAIDHIKKQEQINNLAYYDVLTGLANRTLFIERLTLYMRSAHNGGYKLAIGLIDLERFKNINNSMGRPSGDSLLQQVAEWLEHKTGDTNLIARIDTDHFAVVLPEVKSDGNLAKLIENLIAAFLGHSFRLNNSMLRIGIKVGIAQFPDDGDDASILLRNAEAALYKAKKSGDRFLFYKLKMNEAVADNLALENKLRQAIDKEEFVLHYQPVVNLLSGEITGVEALIRWDDPRTGLVPPDTFIPILEETGLIYEVGRWALRKAMSDYLRWYAAGLPAVRIAVNVSPLQLRNKGFINELRQLISSDRNAAAGLGLEITESIIMENVNYAISSLQAIRDLGITIAIDDFGTGFSSLSYLSKLPVDTLKIDRSFVNNMTTGAQGLSLVSAIITLAHSLKLKVVAEGVETDQELQLLRSFSCDEMQGYLFCKPIPADVLETRFLVPSSGGKK